MDVKVINPFIDAIVNIMPQLGFADVKRGKLSLKEHFVASKGVSVLIGLSSQIQGNVIYNMSEDTVKKIASTMMMGMPVTDIDPLAQSAISELANMLTGNAATYFAKQGISVDISPPNLVLGEDARIKVCGGKFIALELLINSMPLEINIGTD